MAIEYMGLNNIQGPLAVIEGVDDTFYEEMVTVTLDNGEKRIGRVIEISGDKAVGTIGKQSGAEALAAVGNFLQVKQVGNVYFHGKPPFGKNGPVLLPYEKRPDFSGAVPGTVPWPGRNSAIFSTPSTFPAPAWDSGDGSRGRCRWY